MDWTRRNIAGLAAVALFPSPSFAADPLLQDYLLLIFSEPRAGREDEYLRWYRDVHGPMVAANRGVVSGQFYVADPRRGLPPRKYVVAYRIASRDLAATYQGFLPTPEPPELQPIDGKSLSTVTYRACGPLIAGAGPADRGPDPRGTYALFVVDGPVAGQEAEYDRWATRRARDIATTPGVVSARRYVVSDVQRGGKLPVGPRYLTLYTIVTGDLSAAYASMDRRVRDHAPSPALDPAGAASYAYEALAPEWDSARLLAASPGRP